MKNIFPFLVFIAMISSVLASAQQQKNDLEICAGIGQKSGYDLTYSSHFLDSKSADYYAEIAPTPIVSVNIKKFFAKDGAFNVGASYHEVHFLYLDDLGSRRFVPRTSRIFTACAGIQGNYWSSKYLSFYVTAEGGIGLVSPEDYWSPVIPCLYASPLGIRIGNINAVYVEVGYGYKGLYHFGYSLRFRGNPKKSIKPAEQLKS